MIYTIYITDRYGQEMTIHAQAGQTIFEAMQMVHPPVFRGNCGGRGQCLSCTVFIEELKTYQKACKTIVSSDLHIRLPFAIKHNPEVKILTKEPIVSGIEIGVAIDVGTTSIGLCMVALSSGTSLCQYTIYNPQAVYGADVISRIAYAKDPIHAKMLQTLIWESLTAAIHSMLDAVLLDETVLKHISIAANTTMIHLLMGYDTASLGHAPFFSSHLHTIRGSISSLCELSCIPETYHNIQLSIYPGISAFVGADIVSGAVACRIGRQKQYDLLIDLGTNGEILLLNADHGYAGGTACGSAFDGYVTAGGYSTTLLSRIALLRQRGIIREDGRLMPRYRQDGYSFVDGMTITMEMLEQVLKAKAAIRTGIDLLLLTADTTIADCNVYIAGNFGFHLDMTSAVAIGMLPAGANVTVAGNASLNGAVKLLTDPDDALMQADHIVDRTQIHVFANDSSFESRYIQNMKFE